MGTLKFTIEKKIKSALGRAGTLETPRGRIETPAFAVVGTKATVKALTPEQVKGLGAQVVLANTYHLYLEPGEEVIKQAGGLHQFMNWPGPTMTDSGGFQVFSLGAGIGKKASKIFPRSSYVPRNVGMTGRADEAPLVKIDDDGVTFKSYKDGSAHRLTPERSIEIQHNIGADMIFAFDECTSPEASYEYQKEALGRTHRWASRCLGKHIQLSANSRELADERPQGLFGIVQGGRFEDLRKQSADVIGAMGFDGFGIGGSFDKEDIGAAVRWVNAILPAEKPRHLLGIGEPRDLFEAVENGCDLFDCVAPTRRARNGLLYTSYGFIAIENSRYKTDFTPIEKNCACYTCKNFTRAYLSHLFRAEEILACTLATIHNLYFIVNLMKKMRQAILEGRFEKYRDDFLGNYKVSNSLTVGT